MFKLIIPLLASFALPINVDTWNLALADGIIDGVDLSKFEETKKINNINIFRINGKTKEILSTGEIIIKDCYDGDTCTSSEGEKIRLACIDAPELKGKRAKPKEALAAKNFLNKIIKGKKVSIRRVTKDKYGRTVAELSFKGENLQQLLVKEGHAEIYKKFSKPCQWAS